MILATIRSRLRRAVTMFVIVFVVLCHVVSVLHHFPVSSVRESNPLCSKDLGYHFAAAAEGDQFIRGQGRFWGYSPSFMAGYPWGLWNSFSKRGYEISTAVFFGAPVEMSYYLWLVLTAILTPLLLVLAVFVLGWQRRVAFFTFLISVAVYQFSGVMTYLWGVGNVVFPFVCALTVLYVAMLQRCAEGRWRYVVPAGLLLGVIFWLHPLCLVPAVAGTVGVVFANGRSLCRNWNWVRLLLAGGLGGIVVLPWVLTLFSFRELRSTAPMGLASGVKFMIMDFFSDRAFGHPFDRRAILHIVMVLSCAAVIFVRKSPRSSEHDKEDGIVNGTRAFFLAGAVLLMCTYMFQYVYVLRQTQPYRYLSAFALMAVIPAAVGLGILVDYVRQMSRAGRIVACCLLLIILPSLTAYLLDVKERMPTTGLDKNQSGVVKWLKEREDMSGRVLTEDGMLGNMLPYLTGRETIGGYVSDQSPLLNSWSCITPERVFGFKRRAGVISPDLLKQYLVLYDVRFVVAMTDAFRDDLADLDGFCRQISRFGLLSVYEIDGRRSIVWGEDNDAENTVVIAAANSLEIRNPPHREFVLKYHFIKTLKAADGISIRPVHLLDDPVPFIGVDNAQGLDRILIRNTY